MQEADCNVKYHLDLQQTIHTRNVYYHNSTISLPITAKESYKATAVMSEPEEVESTRPGLHGAKLLSELTEILIVSYHVFLYRFS